MYPFQLFTLTNKKVMISALFISISILFSCCNFENTTPDNKYDSLTTEQLQIEYNKQLSIIKQEKNLLDEDSLGIYLHNKLRSEVFPAWYGTTWDFNGYSNKPREGEIACGYFVSTTLKHVGFNLNRFDLAKKYSSSIVKSLCSKSQTYSDIDKMFTYLKSQTDNIYVVGLSSHVGFIEKKGDKIYFIHSNYMGPVAVEKENAFKSEALNSSDIFVLGNLTGNIELMKKWKSGSRIDIID